MQPFTHHCYSDAEASVLDQTATSQQQNHDTARGRRDSAGVIAFGMLVCMAAAFVYDDAGTLTLAVQYASVAGFFLAAIACAGFAMRVPPAPDRQLLVTLSNNRLKQVTEWSQQNEEIKQAVAGWLRDGKQLRERDYEAIASFAWYTAQERERNGMLDALKSCSDVGASSRPSSQGMAH